MILQLEITRKICKVMAKVDDIIFSMFYLFRIAHAKSRTIIPKNSMMSKEYNEPRQQWHHKKIVSSIQENVIPEIPNSLLQAIINVGTYTV